MDESDFEVLDDGARRDSRGRRRLPKAERERLARESFCSALSVRAFARQEGVNYHTLVLWRQQWRQSGGAANQPDAAGGRGHGNEDARAIAFAELRVPGCAPAAALEVHLPDGTLLRGGDAAALATLAKALRC